MNARFTIVGFENELNTIDNKSLKDYWVLDGCDEFSAETLLSTIILKGGQFEPLYSDPNFYYMMNGQWWNKWKPTFTKWCEALHAEYNPLWNKDYYEEVHEDTTDVGTDDTVTGKQTVGHEEGEKHDKIHSVEQLSGKDEVDHDYDKDITTTNEVSAFDAPGNDPYVPHDTSHTDDTLNRENTDTTYGKKTTTDTTVDNTHEDDNTVTENGTIDNDTTNDRDFDRQSHLYGNIGVTTSQSLVKEELELRYWNFYDHVSDIFLDEMSIRVY